MQLPQTAVYALRAMAWLAILPPAQAIPSKDLSEATGIPPHYLSKVLRKLVAAELLSSQKGHGGGFSLLRPPERITVLQVLRAVDYEPVPNTCAFGWGRCDLSDPCPLHPVWIKLSDAFFEWATRSTLADVEYDPERGVRQDDGATC